jgi:hypothetical protein
VPERQLAWKNSGKDGFLFGAAVLARKVLPVTKRVMVNLRWIVNFSFDLGKRMPYLTVSKIGIQRVQPSWSVAVNPDKPRRGCGVCRRRWMKVLNRSGAVCVEVSGSVMGFIYCFW